MTAYLSTTPRRSRAMLAGALVAAIAAVTFGGPPQAAHAADAGDIASLQAALSPGTDPTVTLTASMGDISTNLTIDRDLTLDLAGHMLITGSITISAGHTLTIVVGAGGSNTSYAMNIDGTLKLGSDLVLPNNGTVTVGATGRIVSDDTTKTLSGSSSIVNNGVITAQLGPFVAVTGNNFEIYLYGNDPAASIATFRIYAPTFQAAGESFPTFTRGPGVSISSWTSSEDGTGTAITPTTALSGLTAPSPQRFFAQWDASAVTAITVDYTDTPFPIPAGTGTGLTASYAAAGNVWDITDLVTFSSSRGTIDDISDAYFRPELVGHPTITGAVTSRPSVRNTVDIEVVHGQDVDTVTLTVIPATVAAGGSATLYLSATDFYGNSFDTNVLLGDACNCVDLTPRSSNPTDVIDLATGKITFGAAGTRTITIDLDRGEGGMLSVELDITVNPAPPALAVTGAQPDQAPWAALLLLLGLALLVYRRRTARG